MGFELNALWTLRSIMNNQTFNLIKFMHCSLLPTVLSYKAISKWKEMITIKYATNPAKLCISLLFHSSFIIHRSGPLRALSFLFYSVVFQSGTLTTDNTESLATVCCISRKGDSERFVNTCRIITTLIGFKRDMSAGMHVHEYWFAFQSPFWCSRQVLEFRPL